MSAAFWMCGAGSAWAGDGGDSLGTIQAIIGKPDGSSGFCKLLGMGTNFGTTCPQLPTVTQAILEAAAIGLSPPEMVAAQNDIPAGSNVNAGNPAVVPPVLFVPTPFPFDSTTSPKLSDLLKTLTPLAFISANNSNGAAAATRLYDPNADTFLYAVTVSSIGFATNPGGTVPDTLYMFYDNLSRNSNFSRGETAAKFLLPLTVLNVDQMGNVSERPVATTLKFIAPTNNCSASKVTGDFLNTGKPQTVNATDIGLKCAVVFGKSPTSNANHAIFQLAIPLVVTGASPPPLNTDPAYFYSSLNSDPVTGDALPSPINIGLFTAFLLDDLGTTPSTPNVLPSGASIGIAPTAGPLGPPPTCTPTNSCTPPPSTLALCASLPGGGGQQNGNAQGQQNSSGQALSPAVGAYYAIATTGETLLSAALPGVSTSVCPKL
jgi:hypothetical protein